VVAQQKLEFDRWRTAITIVQRMRAGGITCELFMILETAIDATAFNYAQLRTAAASSTTISQRGHLNVFLSAAGVSGWDRTHHIGALHCGQSGRPLVFSRDESPVNAIFRLTRSGESSTVSPPSDAFNGAKSDSPALIKVI
jgi:hypothetical protein